MLDATRAAFATNLGMTLPGPVNEAFQAPLLTPSTNLDEHIAYVDAHTRPFDPPDAESEWARRAAVLRQRILDEVVFRGVPDAWRTAPLELTWGDTIETGRGYRIRKLRYQALPGLWIPALLYEPDRLAEPAPAVLNVNGHSYDEGKALACEQVRCINLAKRGMLALHPEWLYCGELHRPGYEHNRLRALDAFGVSGVAVFFLAMQRGLDALLSHPHASPMRVAMTGLSGGGWQTILLSALDTRIGLCAPNAGYIGVKTRARFPQDIGDAEQNPADQAALADYVHLTALLAPRPALLIYNELDNCCFQTERALASIYEPMAAMHRRYYGSLGCLEFHNNTDPGTHNYELDNRQQFYRFLNRFFLPQDAWVQDEIPSDDEVLSLEELAAGVPNNNASFASLTVDAARQAHVNLPPAETAAREHWRERELNRLRVLLRMPPAALKAEHVGETAEGPLRCRQYLLRIDDAWTLPAAVIEPASGSSDRLSLLIADAGRTALEPHAQRELDGNGRVAAVDLLHMGACRPENRTAWKYALLLETVGARLLGLQTAHVLAALDWLRSTFRPARIRVIGRGLDAGLAVLCAAAFQSKHIEEINLYGAPESLRAAVRNGLPYEEHPAAFCYEFLRHYDIRHLEALCTCKVIRRTGLE